VYAVSVSFIIWITARFSIRFIVKSGKQNWNQNFLLKFIRYVKAYFPIQIANISDIRVRSGSKIIIVDPDFFEFNKSKRSQKTVGIKVFS
jgi:hypothetical protein